MIYVILFASNEISGDSGSYNAYALSILEKSDWLVNPSFFGNSREPVYPLFLASIYLFFGKGNFFAVYILQIFISTLTIYIIYKLARSTIGEQKSILVLIWSGVYINYIRYSGLVLRETLVFFLLILFFYYFWLLIKYPLKKHILMTKGFWQFIFPLIILIHTDARYLFFIPFLIIPLIYYLEAKKGLKYFSWTLVIIGFLLLPWTIRNYIAYDSIILVNTRTLDLREKIDRKGVFEKRLGNNLFNLSTRTDVTISDNYPTNDERLQIKKGLNPKFRSDEEISVIKAEILPDSTLFGRELYWFKEFWRVARFKADYFPFPDARFQGAWSLKHNISSILCFGMILPFAIIGFFVLYREKNKVLLFLTFPIVIQTFLHILQWGRDRYRIPIDAFIIIFAAYGIFWCYNIYISPNRLKLED